MNPAVISPIALEPSNDIDPIFILKRDTNGLSADERLASRREKCVPVLNELKRAKPAGHRLSARTCYFTRPRRIISFNSLNHLPVRTVR